MKKIPAMNNSSHVKYNIINIAKRSKMGQSVLLLFFNLGQAAENASGKAAVRDICQCPVSHSFCLKARDQVINRNNFRLFPFPSVTLQSKSKEQLTFTVNVNKLSNAAKLKAAVLICGL
ncbi:MAG: hypothetical protein K9I71_12400 [Ignavibacteriales bacterium]|nr:hypothetical protein [Melioribacteraceae bacterium]MCF8316923.1 hypothetical protein [Ignavibacteriales bacterium]MCF8438513.1 hypothetical protein [Ignavibacteriales bacterium]